MLSKDTQLCISMSGNPSNIGTRFHNRLYDELGLDYVYKAFSPTDLEQAVAGIRGLPIRGAAVSMPFKEQVILRCLHARQIGLYARLTVHSLSVSWQSTQETT